MGDPGLEGVCARRMRTALVVCGWWSVSVVGGQCLLLVLGGQFCFVVTVVEEGRFFVFQLFETQLPFQPISKPFLFKS